MNNAAAGQQSQYNGGIAPSVLVLLVKTINAAISAQINETLLLKFKLPSVHATTKLMQQKLYIYAGMSGCKNGNVLFDNQHQWLLRGRVDDWSFSII